MPGDGIGRLLVSWVAPQDCVDAGDDADAALGTRMTAAAAVSRAVMIRRMRSPFWCGEATTSGTRVRH
ncbi:hypothetical protein NKG94_04305 [Micromonospora sp. M12]